MSAPPWIWIHARRWYRLPHQLHHRAEPFPAEKARRLTVTLFRPTCQPTKFEADLSGRVLIPHAVNYLRRHPAGALDSCTREVLRRELVGWLAEHRRMVDTLQAQDLKEYKAEAAEVLAKVNRALGCLDDCGHSENLSGREAGPSGDNDNLASGGDAPRTLAS